MRLLLTCAALSALIAGPVSSADLIYSKDKGPEVLAPYDGYAHWQIQARCSGLIKAHAEFDEQRGHNAEQSRAAAAYFETEAVKRYIADRGVDEGKARAVVSHYEAASRRQWEEQVGQYKASTGRTPANMFVSECAAFSLASSPPAATPPKILIADNAGERVVCERVQVVGSRMPKRVCKVKSDAEEDTREAQDMTRRLQEFSGCRNGNC
jgi:hypothetical protein